MSLTTQIEHMRIVLRKKGSDEWTAHVIVILTHRKIFWNMIYKNQIVFKRQRDKNLQRKSWTLAS